MTKRTIVHVKRDLTSTFPEVDFTFSKRSYGAHHVSWTGGPSVEDVRYSGGIGPHQPNVAVEISRTMDAVEQAAWDVERDAEHAAWIADAPAREAREAEERAARKAAGRAKAAETRAAKRERADKLSRAFPRVAFDLSGDHVEWVDGPAIDHVARLLGVSAWQCSRGDSVELARDAARKAREAAEWRRRSTMGDEELEAEDARKAQEARTARRLEGSRVRAARQQVGRDRRAALLIFNPNAPKGPAHDPRQVSFWSLLEVVTAEVELVVATTSVSAAPPVEAAAAPLVPPVEAAAVPAALDPLLFIAPAWPGVAFTLDTAASDRPVVRWTGGPSRDEVRLLCLVDVDLDRAPDGIEAEVLRVELDPSPLVRFVGPTIARRGSAPENGSAIPEVEPCPPVLSRDTLESRASGAAVPFGSAETALAWSAAQPEPGRQSAAPIARQTLGSFGPTGSRQSGALPSWPSKAESARSAALPKIQAGIVSASTITTRPDKSEECSATTATGLSDTFETIPRSSSVPPCTRPVTRTPEGPFWVMGSRGVSGFFEGRRETWRDAEALARRRFGLNLSLEITADSAGEIVLARLEEGPGGVAVVVLTRAGQQIAQPP